MIDEGCEDKEYRPDIQSTQSNSTGNKAKDAEKSSCSKSLGICGYYWGKSLPILGRNNAGPDAEMHSFRRNLCKEKVERVCRVGRFCEKE